MTAQLPVEQELVVHVFAPLDGPQADPAYAEIRRLWAGCRNELGMTQGIESIGVPASLPERRESLSASVAVAAVESPGGDLQAIVRRSHDLLSLAVAFAPQNRPAARQARHANIGRPDAEAPPNWMDLDQRWSALAGSGSGSDSEVLLGEARLYLGRVAATSTSTPAMPVDASPRTAAAAVPFLGWLGQDPGWTDRGFELEEGVAAWETSFHDDERAARRIVALADQDKDAELSAWLWSRGDVAMPPFARYLLHAAKIRYELRVWENGQRPRMLRERAGAGVSELRQLLEVEPGQAVDFATCAARRRLRADEADIVITSTALREMQRTVEIAASNMRAVLGRGVPDPDLHNLVTGDLELAAWFVRQLDDDACYLDAAGDRAHRIRALAGEQDRPTEYERSAERADPLTSRRFTMSGRQDPTRKVFVVYGRDDDVQERMFGFLRALDLVPLEWEPLVSATGSTLPTLTDVITNGLSAGQAQAVVVLLTGDDIVRLHPNLHAENEHDYEIGPVMQSRPNVLIEVGLALAAFRHRTIIVEIGRLRPIADLAGLNVIRFDGSEVAIGKLVERLKVAGCAVDDKGSEWRKSSRFKDLDAYNRRPPAENA